MRRRIGRVTDVEWMVRSPEYAREIIRVARADPAHTELLDLARRLEAALFPPPPAARPGATRPPAPTPAAAPASEPAAGVRPLIQRYIGSLR
jgi:hypothetical protein